MKPKTELKNNYTSLVPAVEQAARILMYLASAPEFKANLTDISRGVGILKSKSYALLNTLLKFGLVSKDSEGKLYSLGHALISLGQKALDNVNYKNVSKPIVMGLARETRCTALFGIISNESLVITALEQSGQPVESRLNLGYTRPLFYRAHGKAIFATLPEEERERLLKSHKLSFNEESSDFEYDRFKRELHAIRRNGFALDILPGETNPRIRLLASVVFGSKGGPVGSLFIIGFFAKSLVPIYGAKLAEAARKLSTLLGADMPSSSVNVVKEVGEPRLNRNRIVKRGRLHRPMNG
jgi:DNA-binding IclR family transcriptional regulator